MNALRVARTSSIGLFLEDEQGVEILLPKRYVPKDAQEGDEIEVFVYRDSEDRPIATTEQPKARVNQLAMLEVVSNGSVGAFLDWGLPKDLLVPKKEQLTPMHVGKKYLVYVYLDRLTQRLAASSRLERYLSDKPLNLEPYQKVDLIIWQKHELGYRVIVDEEYVGMLYHDQLHRDIEVGEKREGYVNQIREDGKIDVLLQRPGIDGIETAAQELLDLIKQRGGKLPVHDKSSPEKIKRSVGMSKKLFKKAVGTLYKHRLIYLDENGIRLK